MSSSYFKMFQAFLYLVYASYENNICALGCVSLLTVQRFYKCFNVLVAKNIIIIIIIIIIIT
jgi:hypothetical protein